jgi:hypothetical protein
LREGSPLPGENSFDTPIQAISMPRINIPENILKNYSYNMI